MAPEPGFIVCGGCHIDRQLRLTSTPQPGRTNPATSRERLGGVATNIACQLAGFGASVRLVSVQPPDSLATVASRLVDIGIDPWLAPLAGDPPGYTALLAPDGELLIGAAVMALYDMVPASMIQPGIEGSTGPIILDANLPADTITAIADIAVADTAVADSGIADSGIAGEFGTARSLCAAGTSIAKVERLTAALPLLDALVLNRGEAAALLGETGPVDRMALALAADMQGNGLVLVSDGADMAALASGGDVVTARPPRVRLVNANGAGDVMAARLFFDLETRPDMAPATRLDAALAAGAGYAAGARIQT
jgi:sugar/nucleoside kinase (ribokinase family)